MSKGSSRRPCCTTTEEEDIRWQLKEGDITPATFEKKYKALMKKGLIRRNGIIVREE